MPKDKKPGKPPSVPEHIVQKRIEAAETKAIKESSGLAMTIMLTVLLDRFGMEDQIKDVYEAWNERSADVLAGRVKLHEWRNVLRKEYGIKI